MTKKFNPKLTLLRSIAKRLLPDKKSLTVNVLLEMQNPLYYRMKAIELLRTGKSDMELVQAGQLIMLELAYGAVCSEDKARAGSGDSGRNNPDAPLQGMVH
jgi:hypothetical protein